MKTNDEQIQQDKNIFGFEDLRLYHKILDYIIFAHAISDKFPSLQGRQLADSLIHRSLSFAVDITAGSSYDRTEFISYLRDVKIGIRECFMYVQLAEKLGYITEDDLQEAKGLLLEVSKMVSALISSIIRQITRGRTQNND